MSSPAVRIPEKGDAAGMCKTRGQARKGQSSRHSGRGQLVDAQSVAELAREALAPAIRLARQVASAGMVAPGIDLAPGDAAGHPNRGGTAVRPAGGRRPVTELPVAGAPPAPPRPA